MSRTLALLPHALVVASEAPSLFGGPPKLKITTLPTIARVVDGSFVFSDEPARTDEIAVDLLRLVTAPHVDGNARTASAIARRSPARAAHDTSSSRGALPSVNELLDAIAVYVVARGALAPGARFVRPRALLDTELGKGLCARLTSAGLVEEDLAALARPTLVVDALDVRRLDDDMPRLAGAGQAATLAAGLAPHLVAWMVESAGAPGLEVMKSGYDAFARHVAVLQVERRLLHGLRDGVTPCRLGGSASDVFPPLSSSAVRLSPAIATEIERLRASGEKNPKIEGLVAAFDQRAQALTTSWHALRAVEVEVRLPPLAPAAEWWARQEALASLRGDVVVAGANDELFALLRKNARVVPASPAWFVADARVASGTPAPVFTDPTDATTSDRVDVVATAKTAVLAPAPGLADVEPPSLERSAGTQVVTSQRPAARGPRGYDAPFVDPAVLAIGPALGGTLRIVVDGHAVDDAEARLDVVARRGDERVVRLASLPSGQPITHGAVVCVERDPPELT